MSNIVYAGESNLGCERTVNEDFLLVKEIGNLTLAIVADGAGSTGTTFQPASIAALEIVNVIKRIYTTEPEKFKEDPSFYLSEAMHTANRVLCAFKTAHEELYNGYAVCMACCVFFDDVFAFTNTGNTRITLLRKGKTGEIKPLLLTKDQTEGMDLLDQGLCTEEEYYLSPKRMHITKALGISATASLQSFSTVLKDNDFILMTTDGVHYAIRPEFYWEIISRSASCDESVKSIIMAAKAQEYADNMTALLLWNNSKK